MISARLTIVLTEKDLGRITISESIDGCTRVTADVHGMKCYEAKRFINNIINTVRIAFQLIIIHGYNHGTAIKEMLTQNFSNDHVFKQFPDPCNQGVTHMLINA